MTAVDAAGVSPDAGGPSRPGRRAARLMALALAVAVVSVGLWQWRSPDAFGEQGNEVAMYSQIGTTALFGVATPRRDMDPAVLTVHSAEPQITEGDARVDVVVCHPRSRVGGIGAVRGGGLNRFCESHEAAAGAQIGPGDDLILRVHSEEPGRVVVEGIKLNYTHGWRQGSHVTGLTAKATFGTETVREHLDGG